MAASIPSPLPFIVSLLPHLLSSSDTLLPSSSLSSLVRYRHQFLHPSPDSLSYLQAQSIRAQDQELAQIVEDRRQQLISEFGDAIEEVRLGDVGYSFEKHEEGRLTARIGLDERLQVLVSWEKDASAEEEQESDAWHYEDLQLYRAAEKGWHPSVHEAAAAMLQSTKAGSTSSPPSSTTAAVGESETRARSGSYLPAHLDRKEEIVQMEGSDGNIMGDDDYWDGVYSSDEDNDEDRYGSGGARGSGIGKVEHDESQYWQAYAMQESMIPDTPQAPDTPATSSPSLSSPQVKTAAIQEEVPREEMLLQPISRPESTQANGSTSDKSPRDAALQTSIRGLYDLFLLSSPQDCSSDSQQKQDAFLSLVKSAISS